LTFKKIIGAHYVILTEGKNPEQVAAKMALLAKKPTTLFFH
jgi:hypothetical protein